MGFNIIFGPGSMVDEVPYDPFLYFDGEEARGSLAWRLYTNGYSIAKIP